MVLLLAELAHGRRGLLSQPEQELEAHLVATRWHIYSPGMGERSDLALLQQGEPAYLHSLSKSWKLTLLQQGGAFSAPGLVKRKQPHLVATRWHIYSPGMGERSDLALLQQGEPAYLHSLSKSWKLTLLQQGGAFSAPGLVKRKQPHLFATRC